MYIIAWLVLALLLPVLAVVFLSIPRLRQAAPWLGLLTVVVGALPAFSASATLVERGSIGFGVGWLITGVWGLIGLVIVVGIVRLRPVPFIPVAAMVTGLMYVASFYAYLPPWGSFNPLLMLALPGVALVVFGVLLWVRHGLLGHHRLASATR